jgi:hypothetical protein
VVARAKLEKGTPEGSIRGRLRPYMRGLVAKSYQQIADDCGRRGAQVFLVFRPFPFKWSNLEVVEQEQNRQELVKLAAELSIPFLDLSHAFDGVKYRTDLTLAPWDDHTNAKGCRLLAEELYRALHDREGNCVLRLRTSPASP